MLRAIVQRDGVMLALTLVSTAAYLAARFDQRWIPHDEGLLAQTAERVLQGQWPHRDFDDPYTGGLGLLHAAALRVLGLSLSSLRWPLLVSSVATAAVFYRIARRVASPLLAAFVTVLCIAWGMPNYFSGLPSWYNLMLAAGGALCLLRFIERRRRVDLVWAGVLGGLSFLVKAVGLYYLAAGLLTLLFVTAEECESDPAARGSRAESWVIRGLLAVFGLLLASMLSPGAPNIDRLHFTLPGFALLFVVSACDVRLARAGLRLSLRRLLAYGVPFLAGAVVPVALFLIPVVASHSLDAFVHGVFVAPQRRIGSVTAHLPGPWSLIAAVPIFALLCSPLGEWSPLCRRRTWTLLSLLALGLLALGSTPFVYHLVWWSVRPLVPGTVLVCAWMLSARARAQLSPVRRAQLFAIAAITAFVSLVQFPYAYGMYFFYVAPLAALLLLFVIANQPRSPRATWLVLAGFYLAFALLWLNTSHLRRAAGAYVRDRSDTRLALARGGLEVEPALAEIYERLVGEVWAHSEPGSYIYAAPDCPEVYFLSARRNPTRTFYDLFDGDRFSPTGARTQRILHALEQHHVDVVVINEHPEFSGPPDPHLMHALIERYPRVTVIAPLFTVRFRDPRSSQH